MSKNLSFKRKFFILRKEYSNMRNLNPKGHGKLELRNNRLNISLNINYAEKDQYYNIILIGDNKVHELGKIHTDKSYSGKAEFEYNYKDIESIGFPLEKINGILISRDTDILLGGYIDKDDKTIENYIDKLMRADIKPQKKEIIQQEEEISSLVEDELQLENRPPIAIRPPVSENEAIPPEDDEAEVKYIENDLFKEDDLVETIEGTIEETIEETTVAQEEPVQLENRPPIAEDQYIPLDEPGPPIEQENRPLVSPAEVTEVEYDKAMQEVFNDYEESSDEDEVQYVNVESQRKENQKNQTTNYVLNILSFFPFIEPFKIDLMGYNWWKISIDDPREDKGFLPYFSYIAGGNHKYPLVQNTVTARALMRVHGHYLFGLYNVNDEVKFYVYGVPGRFTIEDHPQRGTTGFNTWFEGRENIGYWLLYIDPTTGRIIYPINPMIPKD